ncbi:peptidoglycan DD-metalloendopeptidase family protein [Streptomyces sp. MS06]|uniref:peptidoglycan DD-metalloendopeptidase family protein n=1 Tax=Streptomyces sp. MS06 TaxID=3385974 RepID=UPI0039A0767B
MGWLALTGAVAPRGSSAPAGPVRVAAATSPGARTGSVPRPAAAPAAVAGEPSVPAVARVWPVGTHPSVVRGWRPPATVYGPGHRGVDLAAAPGAPVRAVAAGRVSFAGRVAGRGVLSVELTGTGEPPLRTTYEPVRAAVTRGEEVAAGQVIATVEPTGAHCSAGCLHWGLLSGRTYLDPLRLLPPRLLATGPSRLLPVAGVPVPGVTAAFARPSDPSAPAA